MTVAVASRKLLFPSISGSTGPFSFNFRILMRGVGSTTPQITVTKYSALGVPTVLNYPADYSFVASNGGLSGGTVTLLVAGTAGQSLLISGATPVDQPTRYSSLGKFFPEKHEDSYDQGILIAQEQTQDIARAIKQDLAITTAAPTMVDFTLSDGAVPQYEASTNRFIVGPTASQITSAQGYAVLASQWASQTSGIVAATDFSAKAWAIGGTNVTATAARGASKEWATLTTGFVDTVDYSSKAYAIGGTGVTGAIGSAKEWAISASKPDGVNESAKTYAAQAAVSAGVVNYRFCGTAGGSANALTLTPASALGSYSGALLEFIINTANTTEAMTVNVSGLGIKNIKVALYGAKRDAGIGMFQQNMHCIAQYDGTDVVIINAPWDNQGSDVASAGSISLATTTGNFANITGTTSITAFTGLTKGRRMLIRHNGIHTLTHSATLFLLNNAANITTAVGDFSEWVSDGTNVYMTSYMRADGTPIASTGGGFKNSFINGAFNIWQRNVSYALSTSGVYGSADRWLSYMSASAAGIANRDTSVPSNLGFQYSMKLGRNSGSSLTGQITLVQALETVNSIPLAGRQVTFSYYAKAGANYSGAASQVAGYLYSGTGTDQAASGGWTGETLQINATGTLTTSWQRFQGTVTLPSSVTQLRAQFFYNGVGTAGADDNVYITGVQLEPGAVATAFDHRNFGLEFELCRRYFFKTFAYATVPAQAVGLSTGEYRFMAGKAGALSNTGYYPFSPRMRTVNSVTFYNPVAANAQVRDYTAAGDCSASTSGSTNEVGTALNCTGNAGTAVGNVLGIHFTVDAEL